MYADFRRRWAGTLSAAESYPASEVSGKAERSHPTSEARAATESSNLTPKARRGSWKGQSHVQGVVAVWAQEGLEEPLHVQGQEGQQ